MRGDSSNDPAGRPYRPEMKACLWRRAPALTALSLALVLLAISPRGLFARPPQIARGQTGNSTTPQLSVGGLTSATPGGAAGQVLLSWSPAVDLGGGSIVYDVFQTNAGSGMESLGSPSYQTSSATGFTVTGLNSAN